MIKVMFLPKVKQGPILSPMSFYIDTKNYVIAEDVARSKFSKDPKYDEYGMAICIDISVICP